MVGVLTFLGLGTSMIKDSVIFWGRGWNAEISESVIQMEASMVQIETALRLSRHGWVGAGCHDGDDECPGALGRRERRGWLDGLVYENVTIREIIRFSFAAHNPRTLRLHYPLADVVGWGEIPTSFPFLVSTYLIGNCEGDNEHWYSHEMLADILLTSGAKE